MNGYVCPSIVPSGHKEWDVIGMILRRGLSLTRLHGDSKTLLLIGPGVDIRCSKLSDISRSDTRPPRPPKPESLQK